MPSWSVLHEALLKEKTTPYVFITFSGHGLHFKGKGLEESHICLNDNENVPVNAINPGNPRCTFVFDACRQLILQKGLTETFSANEMIKNAAYVDREKYRQLFDDAVKQAEQGIIQLFSCDIDEAANESPVDGGYYTNELIRCCRTWHDQADLGNRFYYSTWNAHSCAATQTNSKSPQQHPKYNGGRRNKHFPLAIKP